MKIEKQEDKKSFLTKKNHKEDKKINIPIFELPKVDDIAQDSFNNVHFKNPNYYKGVNPLQLEWFANHSFIGYQACVYISNNWLVNNSCLIPARDSIRQGWEIDTEEDIKEAFKKIDKKFKIQEILKNFIYMGKIFGGQLAFFDIEFDNADERKTFYENPFNIDGVTKNSYKGIRLIDPIDVSPILVAKNVQDPTDDRYMKPEYYLIGGVKYHSSHFICYIPYEVPKLAKQRYNYFGVSLPELIYERVYASERTANEAPELTMTKRLIAVQMAGLEEANLNILEENLKILTEFRNSYSVFLGDDKTTITQLETSLADLDVTIMTQYQLVSAISGVPATKLLKIQPKGFNSTGNYEAEDYRQELESIQENDLQPLLERHYQLTCKSKSLESEFNIVWNPLDSPTAKEYAEIEKLKADTDNVYFTTGAIDGADIRKRIKGDKESIYYGLEDKIQEQPNEIDNIISGFKYEDNTN
ncbi:DUF1073 domain-containing protein [Aliarcobacter lanthieri]|uniref:phage portal protein n=1 Tax=Aliarcobacter lanthieri TaxID=1355374 RepID=UPI003AB058CE